MVSVYVRYVRDAFEEKKLIKQPSEKIVPFIRRINRPIKLPFWHFLTTSKNFIFYKKRNIYLQLTCTKHSAKKFPCQKAL